MARGSARHVDAELGWVTRRFREIDARFDGLDTGKLSSVAGATVTIQDLLTDPAGSTTGFVNTDILVAEADDTAVTGTLTYVPIPGSLHVRQNGLDLAPAEWVLTGATLTVDPSADVIIRTTDQFTIAYAYDPSAPIIEQPPIEPPAPPVPADPVLVGSVSVQNSQTSIALPGSPAAGDLIVVTSSAWGSASTSDTRLTGDAGIADSHMFVAWGLEDGSGDPVSVSVDDGSTNWATTTVTVYRDVDVADFALNYNGSSPGVAATYTGAYAALCAVTARNGTGAGTLSADSTGLWTLDESGVDSKVHVSVNRWESATADDTPPGSFALSGTLAALVCTTLLLESA